MLVGGPDPQICEGALLGVLLERAKTYLCSTFSTFFARGQQQYGVIPSSVERLLTWFDSCILLVIPVTYCV